MAYEKGVVRQLLEDALDTRTAKNIAEDYFAKVYEDIGDAGKKSDYVDGLIRYCFLMGEAEVEKLLKLVKEKNAVAFAKSGIKLAADAGSGTPPSEIGLNPYEFLNALSEIDFFPQRAIVDKAIRESPITSFLVHGQMNCGHRMLAKCILEKLIPKKELDKLKPILLDSTQFIDLDGFTRLLNGYYPSYSNLDGFVQQICEELKTKCVLIVVRQYGTLPYELIAKIVSDFWVPLSEAAQPIIQESKKQLALFVVDYVDGFSKTPDCPLKAVQDWTNAFDPHTPVKLKRLEPFPTQDVQNWIATKFSDNENQKARTTLDELFSKDFAAATPIVPGEFYMKVCTPWKATDYSWTTLEKFLLI